MMSVNKLPAATIKLINSAQVITSVSSVVKELIENALDAGATNIEVKLENHGLKKIEVVDNGKGIGREDVWNMCKKSYTSKINSFEDLNKLGTYGFRGEALNSLCAVSKVSVTTKTDSDTVAMTYSFDTNGNVIGSKMSHLNKGTVVTVESLFDNLPVRRQFLTNGKRKADEIKKVETTVKMLAVVHPRLRVVLTHNKFSIWQKNSAPNLRLSLNQAIPPTIVKQLIDLRHSQDQMNLQLLIPEKGCNISSMCYKNPGDTMFLFINHRAVRDRNIEKILQNEIFNYFGHEIPTGKHPTWLLSIVLPPDGLDVNLEPNKTRVILKDMEKIGTIIKKLLFEYYVGPLDAPKDFLDSIDDEISSSAEKRKNSEEIIEVRVKIPKTNQKKAVNSQVLPIQVLNEDNSSSTQILATNIKSENALENHLQTGTPTKTPNLLSQNPEKEKTISDFMNGLVAEKFDENINETELLSCKSTIVVDDNGMDYFGKNNISEAIASPDSCPNPSSGSSEEDIKQLPNSSCALDINSITLSQWSRGDVRLNGANIQSSITLLGREEDYKPPMSNKNKLEGKEDSLNTSSVVKEESLNISNVDYLSKTSDQNESQACERSVSSQMGCKNMAGFTMFATEMINKISEEPKGISFTKVASDLANKWRKLQDIDKEIYNEKAKTKPRPSKERENKANASMRDQLQKFLAKSNEKRVLKKRNYPKIIEASLSIGSLRKALERRVAYAGETGLRSVGDLSEEVKCVLTDDRVLYSFSETRLAESLLFYNNLATMIVPYKVLETNISVTQENLGHSLWSILISLETANDVRTGSVVISDSRITSNGLRIELTKDECGTCFFQVTDVPLHVAFFGLDDLKEILSLIEGEASLDLPLEDCRPLKLISYIRGETIRQISKNSFNPGGGNPYEKFRYWMSSIKPKLERCPHQNCIYKVIDLPK